MYVSMLILAQNEFRTIRKTNQAKAYGEEELLLPSRCEGRKIRKENLNHICLMLWTLYLTFHRKK